jgi:hypothetical protein
MMPSASHHGGGGGKEDVPTTTLSLGGNHPGHHVKTDSSSSSSSVPSQQQQQQPRSPRPPRPPDEVVCSETKNLAFPLKLHYIIDNEPHIEWRSEGTMFEILSMEAFVAKVMPRHFRTASMSSFVRNLNYYGFRKIKVRG